MGSRSLNRLSAVGIKALNKRGHYHDGGGLYLRVSASGSKSWVFVYSFNKRPREMGLGSLSTFSLAEARERARKCRQQCSDGIDPIEHRNAEQQKARQAVEQRRTFEECALEYHKLHAAKWKNRKHADQWINTLTAYAFPVFGKMDVSEVSKANILRALEPIWSTKTETATRLRQRIRAVLEWAAARDYRHENDAQMWDQISRALPKPNEVKTTSHFAACPYTEVYGVLQAVRNSTASESVKNAFEFTVLTAARSGEVRNADWSEIDFDGKRRIIPASKMKAKKEHRIPLSPRAIEILRAQEGKDPLLIFPSEKGKPYSDMTFTMLLRRLGYEFTMHGFRSSFRDWAADKTSFDRSVCEAALAHTGGRDETEAAYFRSDLFDKRKQLMDKWATHCTQKQKKRAEQVQNTEVV
ncbi:MAG TPA: integrase arm-type DNA-binding domain-containing protein [Noviherbaspirillum sp.]|uniref:tyrosine-type recombinase/integrase n=1 Tax=Noviherbaspirillum sp. TaxID=1926288 RepID=UPI002B48C28E|nr:integrase arm-type DNA-binding domain-containing protein [Noviherbaspirillum sp.]HJV88384.1 integrase arm-type DNA-binding domain-containing protein [Noviherbaspirillum sp.]